MQKNEEKIKKRNLKENCTVVVIFIFLCILELLKHIPCTRQIILTTLGTAFPLLYPAFVNIFINIHKFAENSFTQVIALFSTFSTITFFIIGHFKEGIIGVPLEQLLDHEYGRNTIEKRKIFVLFSPILVCFYNILGFYLLAFYTGMLTLFTVIFSAFCTAIATDRKRQEKIAWNIVTEEFEVLSSKISSDIKNLSKTPFIISDRYNSQTLSKLTSAMDQNQNLFWSIGNDIFDFFLKEENWKYTYFADITYHNIESIVYSLLKNISTQNDISYVFNFLELQMQKTESKLSKSETSKHDTNIDAEATNNNESIILESIIMGIICGTISSCVKGSENFIEYTFGDIWKTQEKTLYKLNILLYLEFLYFNNQRKIALHWANVLMVSKITYYRELHNLLLERNRSFFLRYIMLWENTEKDILNANLNIYYNLLNDIQTIDDKNNMNSFIGGIVKGRKRRTDEKYM